MDTTTLLVIVGSVVCVKTLAFVSLIVRRDRRQRRALDSAAVEAAEARAAARAARESVRTAASWRLQWAEPGVLLVENTSDDAAREVRLVASLTAGCGAMAEVDQRERFVGTGACFLVRFAELEEWLAEEGGLAGYVAPVGGRETAFPTTSDGGSAVERLTCTFDYALGWLTAEGEWQRETRTGQLVVPVPDLALEAA